MIKATLIHTHIYVHADSGSQVRVEIFQIESGGYRLDIMAPYTIAESVPTGGGGRISLGRSTYGWEIFESATVEGMTENLAVNKGREVAQKFLYSLVAPF